jgi:hypothetical protein
LLGITTTMPVHRQQTEDDDMVWPPDDLTGEWVVENGRLMTWHSIPGFLQRTGCIKGQVIYQGFLEKPKPGFGGGGGFIGLRIKKVD